MKHRKLGITGQIVLAMILAVVVGMTAGQHVSPIKIVGDIFFRLIQMPIILLVMGQLIEAVGGLNPKEMGGMGRKTISIFLISSVSAAILGSVAGIWLKPGNDIKLAAISEQTSDTTVLEINSLSETILGFFSKKYCGIDVKRSDYSGNLICGFIWSSCELCACGKGQGRTL